MTDETGRPSSPRKLDRAPGERYRPKAPGDAPGSGPTTPASGAGGSAAPGGSSGAGGAAAPGGGNATVAGSRTRALLAGSAAAALGAVVYAVLGQIDLGLGLVAVAGFVGWIVAIAIIWGAGAARPIPRQPLVAALLGAGAIVAGLLLAWAWSRVEGGVLGPLEYTDQRYGPIAYLEILVAGAIAGLRAR